MADLVRSTPTGPLAMVMEPAQLISLHTYSGAQLFQFTPDDQVSVKWGREQREVTSCDLTLPAMPDYATLPEIIPWLHWISVWDARAERLRWQGPIQKVIADRTSLVISSRDISAYFARTRVPFSKQWDAADPAQIAGQLWAAMIDHHNLKADPIIRFDPEGDRFDFSVEINSGMLSATMDDLVKRGLRWTVVAGTPILGPAPRDSITELGVNDFQGDGMRLIRDGTNSFNDVMVRGADGNSHARYEMGGLGLQQLISLDDLFGVSNADRAVRQYARYYSQIRDVIDTGSAPLHPNAPISIDELIPSIRVTIAAFGLQSLQELESVSVEVSRGQADVSPSFESVVHLPELALISSTSGDNALTSGVETEPIDL